MKRLSIVASLLVLLGLSVAAASAGEVTPSTQHPMTGTTDLPAALKTNMVRLAVGGWATACSGALDGSVMCWGSNGYGEVGDGTTTTRPAPVYVSELDGVTALAAGESHTCALADGGAKCWGRNSAGQLGNNSITESHTPVSVQTSPSDSNPLSGVTAIAAGNEHTCAIVSGVVMCWGNNLRGQLGDGTTNNSSTPVAVHTSSIDPTPLSGAIALAAGLEHTCALMSTGGVKCWGRNAEGELGNRSNTESHTPVDVQTSSTNSNPLSGATEIDAGDNHTCAVVNGGAKCWGLGGNGQLGNGSTTSRNTPMDVTGLTSGVGAIAGGAYHTCALTTGGGAKCWGYNAHGQLGNGTTTQSLIPVDVSGLGGLATAIDTGHATSCALMSTGDVQCWGYNAHGELGIGTVDNEPHSAPVSVALPVVTTAAVTSSANPAVVGQTIVFTATLSSGDPLKTPTGNVTIYDGATSLGTRALNATGQVTQSVTAAGVGEHSITAAYAGATGFDPSTSPIFSQTINKASTLTTLSPSSSAALLGSTVVYTATVTVAAPGAGTPSGTVSFKDGASTIAGCTQAFVKAGQASCTSSALGAGSHALTALYSGDASFTPSTSAALNVNIFRLYLPLTIK